MLGSLMGFPSKMKRKWKNHSKMFGWARQPLQMISPFTSTIFSVVMILFSYNRCNGDGLYKNPFCIFSGVFLTYSIINAIYDIATDGEAYKALRRTITNLFYYFSLYSLKYPALYLFRNLFLINN